MSDVVQGPYLGVGIGKLDEGQAVFGHEVAHRGHLILRATPTKVTSGCAVVAFCRSGASFWQVGHHGAQNHSTAFFPARLLPAKSAPSMVCAVKFSNRDDGADEV